jgi:CheY-like chemotaxis protein
MGPVKLVFVEDDPDDHEMIHENLTLLGVDDFLILDSEASLFNFLGSLEVMPEAIVLDLNLPQMDGIQILKHLKTIEDYQIIPVYILTTLERRDLKQLCIREGAAAYYTKPHSVHGLKSLLQQIYRTE